MSDLRQSLVRFWALDHPKRTTLEWPISPWPKLVYASSGVLTVDAADRIWLLPATRGLWMLPGTWHRMTCYGPVSVRTLYFRPGTMPDLPARSIEVRPLFRELIVETCQAGPLVEDDARHRALFELLSHELRQASSVKGAIPLPHDPDAKRAALALLREGIEPVRVEDLVRTAGLSRRTLERRFVKETGMSLGRWCREARLLAAVRSLGSGAKVEAAALAAGYTGASAFIHAFRRQFGVTPGEWSR